MKVRACTHSCTSYTSNAGVRVNVLTARNKNRTKMTVKSLVAGMVRNDYVISVYVVKSGRRYSSAERRIHRSSRRARHINAGMVGALSVERRTSPPVIRRKPVARANRFMKQISVNFLARNPVKLCVRNKNGSTGRKFCLYGNRIYPCALFCTDFVFFCNGFCRFAVFTHGVDNSRHRRNFKVLPYLQKARLMNVVYAYDSILRNVERIGDKAYHIAFFYAVCVIAKFKFFGRRIL